MPERSYTVKEIDDLRRVLTDRYLWGTCVPSSEGRLSRSYREDEMAKTVEERLRTHMLAGHTAQDLIDADTLKD